MNTQLTPVQLGTAEHLRAGWTAAVPLTLGWALVRKAEHANAVGERVWGDPEEDESNYDA